MGPQHKRVYARLRRAMRGDDPSRICWVRFAKMRGDRACTSHDVKQHISFPRRISAPGVCNFASLTPNRGVVGAPRDVRVLGGTPLGRIMTRYARRLRGALRPMTQQDTSRNNLTISMFGDASVPIVSQTEIDPMKTALSVMLRRHDDGPQPSRRPYRKPPGRAPRAHTAISHRARSACRRRALRTPIANPGNGTCPWGWISSGSYCLRNGRRN